MRCAPDMVGELLDSQFVKVSESYSVTCSFIPTFFWVHFSTEGKEGKEGKEGIKEEGTSKP